MCLAFDHPSNLKRSDPSTLPMNCPLCKGEMVKSKTNLPYEIGEDRLLVIKDVPAIMCRQCGEYFMEIQVGRVVEGIVKAAEKDGVMLGFLKYQEAA